MIFIEVFFNTKSGCKPDFNCSAESGNLNIAFPGFYSGDVTYFCAY